MAKDILSQCNWDLRDSIDKTVQIGLCPNSVSTSDATPQDHTHDATPQDRTPDYEIGSTPGCHPKLLTGHSTSSGVYYDEDPFCGPLPPPPPPPSLETPPSGEHSRRVLYGLEIPRSKCYNQCACHVYMNVIVHEKWVSCIISMCNEKR